MELLKIEHVSKTYSGHQALKDISLEVPEGCIFGLLGPNGAGKTTLIRIITRIIEQDSGNIYLRGEQLSAESVRKIGYLPEERGLYKKMKVGEQLLYLARLKGLSRKESIQKIKFWLEKLDLTAWQNKNIEDLSKGMAQKVQFIATVLHEPDLIILDEPFSGFDPVNANLIKDEILELRKKGATILFSTHRMESVEELCDHIALINKSEKIMDGKKVDIKNSHRDGTYQVITEETVQPTPAVFEILQSHSLESGLIESILQNRQLSRPNDLLKALITTNQVHSFTERMPTINEIFIKSVEGQTDKIPVVHT